MSTQQPTGPMSFEEAGEYLDMIADEIPQELFDHLNGGVVLSPDTMPSPHGAGLFTLGTYHNEPYGLGRYIVLYYGSLRRAFGHTSRLAQQQELRKVLLHELTHHVESLAGVRDLEIKDADKIQSYRKNLPNNGK